MFCSLLRVLPPSSLLPACVHGSQRCSCSLRKAGRQIVIRILCFCLVRTCFSLGTQLETSDRTTTGPVHVLLMYPLPLPALGARFTTSMSSNMPVCLICQACEHAERDLFSSDDKRGKTSVPDLNVKREKGRGQGHAAQRTGASNLIARRNSSSFSVFGDALQSHAVRTQATAKKDW